MSEQSLANSTALEVIDEPIDPEEIRAALKALNTTLRSIRSKTIRSDLREAYDRISRLTVWEV